MEPEQPEPEKNQRRSLMRAGPGADPEKRAVVRRVELVAVVSAPAKAKEEDQPIQRITVDGSFSSGGVEIPTR